jgi:hypothetical protein
MGLLDWIRRRHPGPLPDTLTPGTTELVRRPRQEPTPQLVKRLQAECAAVPEVVAAYLYEAAALAEDEEPHPTVGLQLESNVDYARIEELLERIGRVAAGRTITVQVLADELLYEVQATVPPFYERDAG